MHAIATQPKAWRRFAALGDSFTEGLSDVLQTQGRYLGWADRVAMALADAAGANGVEYANLAVRGRLIREVVHEQVPLAIEMRPDLTSLAVGINDSLRRRFDLDSAATDIENGVRDLRRAGSDVLIFEFGDPSRRSLLMGRVRGRIAAYNGAVEAIARQYGCYVVRYWDVAVWDDDRYWAADRLHLSPSGHALAAQSALEALGLADASWRTPVVPGAQMTVPARLVDHATWFGGHAAPWLLRRLRGASSGDGITPKYPEWMRVDAQSPLRAVTNQ